MGFIYFIRPGNTNEYKIGCSRKDDMSELNSYGKDTVVFYVQGGFSNVDLYEPTLRSVFNRYFPSGSGEDCYDGNLNNMKRVFDILIKTFVTLENERAVSEPVSLESDNDLSEWYKKLVREFLGERLIVTNNATDRITTDEMFQLFQAWWEQYKKRPIVDLDEFNQYVREELPVYCRCERSFFGLKPAGAQI